MSCQALLGSWKGYLCSHLLILLPDKKINNVTVRGLSSNIRINAKIKINIVIAVVFPAVMYGCEIWTIKKVEH